MHVGMTTFFQNIGHAMSDSAVYAHEMSMADLAEPLGFDSLWSAEHHFDDYTMCPNVAQFLTYMAGRTRKVKLGSMVMVLPWNVDALPKTAAGAIDRAAVKQAHGGM